MDITQLTTTLTGIENALLRRKCKSLEDAFEELDEAEDLEGMGYKKFKPTHKSKKSGLKVRVTDYGPKMVKYVALGGGGGAEKRDRFDNGWVKLSESIGA